MKGSRNKKTHLLGRKLSMPREKGRKRESNILAFRPKKRRSIEERRKVKKLGRRDSRESMERKKGRTPWCMTQGIDSFLFKGRNSILFVRSWGRKREEEGKKVLWGEEIDF